MEAGEPEDRHLLAVIAGQLRRDFGGPSFPCGPRGQTLLCVSDFSGAHRGALYNTYAFLGLDLDRNGWWLQGQREFRDHAFKGKRRLSFKALNDRARRQVLPLFLAGANEIEGALWVVAIRKDFGSMFEPTERSEESNELLAAWKPAVHEHLLRVTHLGALFGTHCAKPGQDVFWIADQDEIASNERQLHALTTLTMNVWSNILEFKLRHLRVGTTATDDGSLAIEDLAAIADLAAGGACELVSAMERQNTFPVRGIVNRLPIGLTAKTQHLLQWLSMRSHPLRRSLIVIDEPDGKRPRLTKLAFEPLPDLVIERGRGSLA